MRITVTKYWRNIFIWIWFICRRLAKSDLVCHQRASGNRYEERPYFYSMNLFNRPLLICLFSIAVIAGCDEPPKKHVTRHAAAADASGSAAAEKNTLPPPDIFVA